MLVYQVLLSCVALFFGSLTGVLVKRVPKNQDFVFSRSKCPECDYQLKWYENIPLISYLFLFAKCSNCKTKIPYFYPAIELVFLFACFPFVKITAKRFLFASQFSDYFLILLDFFFFLFFISLALALGLIDQKHKELPHQLTYLGILLALIYATLFGSEHYAPSVSISETLAFVPSVFLYLFSSIKQFAIVAFVLDISVYFLNLFFFKEDALLDGSSALCFAQEKLLKNQKIVFLAYLLVVLSLVYFSCYHALEIFFVLLGFSYLIFEIFPYLLAKNKIEQDENSNVNKKTVLGGGDVMFVAFMATVIGFKFSFLVFLASFYLAFMFLMFKIIKKYFQFQMQAKTNEEQASPESFDIKAILSGTMPLGLALAISFITAMIVLAK